MTGYTVSRLVRRCASNGGPCNQGRDQRSLCVRYYQYGEFSSGSLWSPQSMAEADRALQQSIAMIK